MQLIYDENELALFPRPYYVSVYVNQRAISQSNRSSGPFAEVSLRVPYFHSSTSSFPQFWLAFWVLISYLSVAIALPVTPLFITQHLGMSNTLGGLAVGIAFVSTIATRGWVGRQCDRIGGKPCMMHGLIAYAVASLICAAAAWRTMPAGAAYALVIAGRLLMGLGESQTLLGALSWGIVLAGPERSGRFMSWLGAGMYGSFALGGPLGLFLYAHTNYAGAMAACVAAPLLGMLALSGTPAAAPPPHDAPVSFLRIVGSVWRQGAVLGLQGVGFAVLGAFLSIDFLKHRWTNAGAALSIFAGGFVLVRFLCSHLPDRIGGYKVAAVSIAVEAVGMTLLWLAPANAVALLGALLTGVGCSMMYPAMGVEVVRKVKPQLRGSALGGYSAFQDVAYIVSAPMTGLLADHFGISVVFLAGAIAAVLGLGLLLTGRGAALPALDQTRAE